MRLKKNPLWVYTFVLRYETGGLWSIKAIYLFGILRLFSLSLLLLCFFFNNTGSLDATAAAPGSRRSYISRSKYISEWVIVMLRRVYRWEWAIAIVYGCVTLWKMRFVIGHSINICQKIQLAIEANSGIGHGNANTLTIHP